MATPKDTLWPLDPHTAAKHAILRRYLDRWFPILNTHHDRIVYIDGFCGPGRYSGGEIGSPLVALEAAAKHRKAMRGDLAFWFIDERDDRIHHLSEELSNLELPDHFRVEPTCGRFDAEFKKLLDSLESQSRKPTPTFAFVDPFGFSGIPFDLIKRYLGRPRCEAFINFMVDSINRFLDHPNDEIVRHIPETFGTDEALAIAKGQGDRVAKLRDLYQSQLRSVASYVRYFEMRDGRDRVQYFLFFASNHPLGHIKMKEAMWLVDPEGTYRFSDKTVPGQSVMFDADPAGPLLELLRKHFNGKGRTIVHVVKQYVENETAYLESHMKAALRRAEEVGQLEVEPLKSSGSKRRAGAFTDDTVVEFIEKRPGQRGLF